MRTCPLFFLATLLLSLVSVAPAVTIYSPPIRSSQGNNFDCVAQNVSANAVQVSAQINDGLGHVVDSGMLSIPSGEALQLVGSETEIFGGYCSFTFDGDPAAVRGVVTLEDRGGSDTRLLYPARPAGGGGGPMLDTTLATPPVRSDQGNNLNCVAQNLGTSPVQVISQINDGLNNIVNSVTFTVPSSQALTLASTTSAVFGAYCTFHFQAPAETVRGFATRQDIGGSDTRLLVEATPTVTAPPVPACCGDCNADGQVTVPELIQAVNLALSGMCPAPF